MKWIINDIFGYPSDSEKKGLMQCNSPMDFEKKYLEFKPNWIKLETSTLQEVVQNSLAILKNTKNTTKNHHFLPD